MSEYPTHSIFCLIAPLSAVEALASYCLLQSRMIMTEWPARTKRTSSRSADIHFARHGWNALHHPATLRQWYRLCEVDWDMIWGETAFWASSKNSHSFSTHLLAPALPFFGKIPPPHGFNWKNTQIRGHVQLLLFADEAFINDDIWWKLEAIWKVCYIESKSE